MHRKKIRYVTPDETWVRRQKKGDAFVYIRPNGKCITAHATLERVAALGIPPAYQDVRICPIPHGHIQAVGQDNRGRKQYVYHPDWVHMQSENKFQRLLSFGMALPKIRQNVTRDLRKQGMCKEKILAAMVRIMDLTNIRVGNATYAKDHQTYGLTTLRKKHARIKKNRVLFSFKGKNETPWALTLENPAICKVIKKCAEVPGHVLFKYEDEKGEVRPVCSEDFNQYLSTISENDFTAKDFRTWAACREMFQLLAQSGPMAPEDRPAYLKAAIKDVAGKMGHTVAICRKSYVHPQLLKGFEKGTFQAWLATKREKNIEKLLLKWWKDHVKNARVRNI